MFNRDDDDDDDGDDDDDDDDDDDPQEHNGRSWIFETPCYDKNGPQMVRPRDFCLWRPLLVDCALQKGWGGNHGDFS